MTKLGVVALTAVGAGFAGWAIENTLVGPRYSYHLPRTPFLPVYAAGGAAVALLAPVLEGASLPAKLVAYGATLTAIEGIAGAIERSRGRASWDYAGGTIDLKHAAAWALLGTLLGDAVNAIEKR